MPTSLVGIRPLTSVETNSLPSRRMTTAPSASHRCAAWFTMPSKTASRLPGLSLISCRISEVAVCSSSDSDSSLLRCSISRNRRALSTAMAAWSANVSSRAISSSVYPPGSARVNPIAPMAAPPRIIGTASALWWPIVRAGDVAYEAASSLSQSLMWTISPRSTAAPVIDESSIGTTPLPTRSASTGAGPATAPAGGRRPLGPTPWRRCPGTGGPRARPPCRTPAADRAELCSRHRARRSWRSVARVLGRDR